MGIGLRARRRDTERNRATSVRFSPNADCVDDIYRFTLATKHQLDLGFSVFIGFKRIYLAAGEGKTVKIPVKDLKTKMTVFAGAANPALSKRYRWFPEVRRFQVPVIAPELLKSSGVF